MTQNDKSSDPRPLWQWSATEIATATHRGALSASEVVEAALDRLDAVNPDLNAVVEVCVDAARAEAKALDASDAPKGTAARCACHDQDQCRPERPCDKQWRRCLQRCNRAR